MIIQENTGLAAERLQKIRDFLRLRRAARVAELRRALGVSSATVRRDLAELEAVGQVKRVHGGAVGVEGRLEEPLFDDKASIASAEKRAIAGAALACVKANMSVFLDGGSTVLLLAELLAGRADITVATNSLRVAGVLSAAGPHLILIGGELRRKSQTFVGPLTEPVVENLRFDLAFMGTMGLSAEDGLTTTDPHEAFTKGRVMGRSRQVVLLADSSKIDAVSFVSFAKVSEIGTLITDAHARAASVREFRKLGVNVVLAGSRRTRNAAAAARKGE